MGKRIVLEAKSPETPIRPALNPEDREQQLGNLALNLAEQQLLDGTASSQVITYFLKATSQREKYERERLQEENKKLRAQTEALQSVKHLEELYSDAMKVFRGYQGLEEDEEGY
jgi:hypothetical protein